MIQKMVMVQLPGIAESFVTEKCRCFSFVFILSVHVVCLLATVQPTWSWLIFQRHHRQPRRSTILTITATREPPWLGRHYSRLPSSDQDYSRKANDNDDDGNGNEAWYENLDVLLEGDDPDLYGDDTFEDWIPDAELSKRRRRPKHLTPAKEVIGRDNDDENDDDENKNYVSTQSSNKKRPSPYTEEEEELIDAMGGKTKKKASKREEGFLGDCTLREIAMDYSVPICYLADVLCMWGVPVPINIHDRLGDLVTGEQAFALVEAVNSLDAGALNDRYSNQNLAQLCYEWEIELKDAFEFAMKEGWSLPFGVRTNLRVEQEDELLRVFSTLYQDDDGDDN